MVVAHMTPADLDRLAIEIHREHEGETFGAYTPDPEAYPQPEPHSFEAAPYIPDIDWQPTRGARHTGGVTSLLFMCAAIAIFVLRILT